jgi:GNAT superfamily N-acetyltransferase
MPLDFVKMAQSEAADATRLLTQFLTEDEFYLDSAGNYGDSGPGGVARAVTLFLARPELGFVWLGYDGDDAMSCCIVSFAISTSAGALVGKLDDVYVAAPWRGKGAGSAMIEALKAELKEMGCARLDTAVHMQNAGAARFYARLGFRRLNEERLAAVLYKVAVDSEGAAS